MGHITVTPADEDEVVIAGSKSAADLEAASGSETGTEAASGSAPEPEPEPVPAPTPEPAPEPALRPEQRPEAAAAPKPARSERYRETTLEDLESPKMPLAQRIVIIAAIVCR